MVLLFWPNISLTKYFEIQFLDEKYQIPGSVCTPAKEIRNH